jgi:hypothetical protein
MRYTVDWIASAEKRLEEIWMLTANRLAVLNAAIAIDVCWADDPYRKDAIMVGEENIFIIEPLAVDYAVFDDANRVLVLSVWMIGNLSDSN